MNYLILSALVIVLSYAYDYFKRANRLSGGVKWIFYAVICFMLCLFAGLRTDYNDTPAYISNFNNTPFYFSSLFYNEFSISEVYLFKIWNYVIYHFITKNVNVYLFLCATVFVCPAVRLIERYSKNFTISMLLFMFAGMYLFSLAGLKQALATGIIMMGVPYLIDKKYFAYYVFCFIALGFHAYSLFFLIIPLLGRKIFNVRTVAFSALIIVLGIGLSYFSNIISVMIEFLGKDVDAETLDSGSVNAFRALVFAVPLVLTVIGRKRLESVSEAEKNFVKIGFLSSIFMILALFGNPILFGRIPQYFLIGIVVSLPLLIEKAFVESERKTILSIAAVCYTLFGAYSIYNAGGLSKDIFKLIWF